MTSTLQDYYNKHNARLPTKPIPNEVKKCKDNKSLKVFDEIEEKLNLANERLKKTICQSDFMDDKTHWIYIDFVIEDRFINEIKTEKEINYKTATCEDLVLFACSKIDNSLEEIYNDEFN